DVLRARGAIHPERYVVILVLHFRARRTSRRRILARMPRPLALADRPGFKGVASALSARYANVIGIVRRRSRPYPAMKLRTLVSHQRYFGMEPISLRHGAGRVLLRVAGLPPERARVSAQRVREDFGMDTVEGEALVNQFVESGLLEPYGERAGDYR